MMDFNILVGGAAGLGVDTISRLLEKTLKRNGYQLFCNKDYMSRIRGGHNFTQIRISTNRLSSHRDDLDLVIALDIETIFEHQSRINKHGKILCDSEVEKKADSEINNEMDKIISLPLKETAREAGNLKVMGTVSLGCTFKMLGLTLEPFINILKEYFKGAVLDANLKGAQLGYDMVEKIYEIEKGCEDSSILIDGNQAVALGALAAGCKLYAAYPMTPSTSIMTYLSSKASDAQIVVEQVEDEIAAINTVLGASYAGIRAMTGTSGGGFSLMVEALGLAGITETPLVVAEVQRPGPATGLPTRTEQSDLLFCISASHGEIPRMVIALRDGEDAFYQTTRAFNLAEKYQIPVILLSDQYLADSSVTLAPFDFSRISIQRHLSTPEGSTAEGWYKRYAYTDTGISPRIVPGRYPNHIVLADSDEHDEQGHIIESGEIRSKMMDKRLKKIQGLKNELQEPMHLGHPNPDVLIAAWGSTYGPIKEAVEQLNTQGYSIAALVFGDIWPLPIKTLENLASKAEKIINVEQNATGQLGSLMREAALIPCSHSILKYNGRPFSGQELYHRIKQEVLS